MLPAPQADATRRALLHAAWAAPTIVVATAVPAAAMTSLPGAQPTVTVTVSTIRGFDNTLRVTNVIRNTSTVPTTGLSMVTTISPTNGQMGTAVVIEPSADTAWSATTGGTAMARTVTLTKNNGVLAAGGTITMSYRVAVTSRTAGLPLIGTVTTTPTPTPGTGTAGAGPINDT